MKKVFVGIDSGLKGAIAVLDEDGDLLGVKDMPLFADGKNVDVKALYDLLLKIVTQYKVFVTLEECYYTPKLKGSVDDDERNISVMTAFKFGRSYQSAFSVLEILQVPRLYIKPTIWKKDFFLFSQNKIQSVETAIQLYPAIANELKYVGRNKTMVYKDGRAEAILIARYGWKYQNNLRRK